MEGLSLKLLRSGARTIDYNESINDTSVLYLTSSIAIYFCHVSADKLRLGLSLVSSVYSHSQADLQLWND